MIIQGDIINASTLRTYSTVEKLSKGDTISFKLEGTDLILFFQMDVASHSKITITKLDNPILYTLMDNGPTNVKYDNGGIIGSNSAFKSTSSEWDSNKGIFTVSSDGNYLINTSLFINNFYGGITRISMFINNKARYMIGESQQSNGETLRTYSTVEKLSKGDTIYFKLTDGNNFVVFFGSDPGSHSKITITKLN
jgi:endonuclease YncB( thermonuclease family)